MKSTGLALLLCFLTLTGASAQRLRLFRAIVTLADGSKLDGILYDVTDSTLSLAPNTPEAIALLRADKVPVLGEAASHDIVRITIRRKGHGLRGAGFGAAVGLSYGIGYLLLTPSVNTTGSYFFTTLNTTFRQGLVAVTTIGGIPYGLIASVIPRKTFRPEQSNILFQQQVGALWQFSVRGQRPLP